MSYEKIEYTAPDREVIRVTFTGDSKTYFYPKGSDEFTEALSSGFLVNDFSEPALEPLGQTLTQVQFFTLLEYAFNKEPEEIVAMIQASIPDKMERIAAKQKFMRSTSYSRANPLFDVLGQALGITPKQINDAWIMALQVDA